MVRTPLPSDLATAARSYLAAFIGDDEAVDALHEVADDVAYWGDDSLPAVLAVTHEVLKSRARVTSEAAVSWLVDELELDPAVAALIVGLSEEQVPQVEETEEAEVEEEAEVAGSPPRTSEATEHRSRQVPRGEEEAGGYRAGPTQSAPADRVRIGFDEEPLPESIFHEPSPSRFPFIAGAVLILLLVVAGTWIATRG